MIPPLPEVVYRVAREEHARTPENALSGIGGLRSAGRWHMQGRPIIYTSENTSLALLERIVHAGEAPDMLTPDRLMLSIKVPPAVSVTHYTAEELGSADPLWRDVGNKTCVRLGTEWLRRRLSCALIVPSAANPFENNILLNPAHDDFDAVLAMNTPLETRPIVDDARVVALAAGYHRAPAS